MNLADLKDEILHGPLAGELTKPGGFVANRNHVGIAEALNDPDGSAGVWSIGVVPTETVIDYLHEKRLLAKIEDGCSSPCPAKKSACIAARLGGYSVHAVGYAAAAGVITVEDYAEIIKRGARRFSRAEWRFGRSVTHEEVSLALRGIPA